MFALLMLLLAGQISIGTEQHPAYVGAYQPIESRCVQFGAAGISERKTAGNFTAGSRYFSYVVFLSAAGVGICWEVDVMTPNETTP